MRACESVIAKRVAKRCVTARIQRVVLPSPIIRVGDLAGMLAKINSGIKGLEILLKHYLTQRPLPFTGPLGLRWQAKL
jgi:acyl-CoA hydrolase